MIKMTLRLFFNLILGIIVLFVQLQLWHKFLLSVLRIAYLNHIELLVLFNFLVSFSNFFNFF